MENTEHLHLLVVATNFAETRGGVEGYLKSLLPRLVERGVDVSVVYLGRPRAPYLEDGIKVMVLRRWVDFRDVLGLPSLFEWRRFTRAVVAGSLGSPVPFTHVATHTRFFPMSYLGVWLARRLKVPVLHTEHGAGFVSTSSRLVEFASRLVDLTLGRAVLRGADRVVAVSAASRAFVRDLAGVEATQLHNGVDVATWTEGLGSIPSTDMHQRRLVFVGRLVREKGWRTFLDICVLCRERGFRGRVVVLGDGPEMEQVHEYARELGLAGVETPGHQPATAVREWLHDAVYVNPSTAAEGFQMTLVEALVAGAAVVSYAVGCADELEAQPAFDITVVAKGDAEALALATWAALQRPVRRAPQELLREWDWDPVADRYVRLLRTTR